MSLKFVPNVPIDQILEPNIVPWRLVSRSCGFDAMRLIGTWSECPYKTYTDLG